MGNQQPKHSEDGLQNHQRLGPIRILEYQDPQSQEIVSIMELQKVVESQSIVNSWKSQMMRIDDTQSRQILLLPQKYEFTKSGMCGSSGNLNIVYENLSYVLKGQIQNRFKINRFFQEREVWYLLYNMIRAGNKFQRIKRKVGNMHPNNILINDDGQIKIIATCSIPGEVDNFQLMTQNYEAQAFLAPEELAHDAVQNANYPAGANPCLAEVFSIGLTILSAGTLLQCDDVYEKRKDSIKLNQNNLQSHIKSFKDRYSLFLSEIVSDMLAISPNNRKSSSEIYQILYRYENQILDLEPFAPPERYTVPEPNIVRNSNYYPMNNSQGPQMMASKAFGSNVYTQPQPFEVHTMVPMIQVNESRLQRSTMPPQHMITSSQMPGQYVQMNESMGYSGQYHPIINPTVQQSGMYAQKQSYVVPASSSSVMSGSFYPVQQSPRTNVGPNVGVVQSNYIPNYQFRH